MFAYFSKSEAKCSTLTKVALKEAENLDKSKLEVMKNVVKAYDTNYEYSVQGAAYLIMPKLWL